MDWRVSPEELAGGHLWGGELCATSATFKRRTANPDGWHELVEAFCGGVQAPRATGLPAPEASHLGLWVDLCGVAPAWGDFLGDRLAAFQAIGNLGVHKGVDWEARKHSLDLAAEFLEESLCRQG